MLGRLSGSGGIGRVILPLEEIHQHREDIGDGEVVQGADQRLVRLHRLVQFRDEFAEVFVVFSPDHNQEPIRPLVSNELSLAAQEVCLAPAGNDCSLLPLRGRCSTSGPTASEHLAQGFHDFFRIGSL